MFSNFRISKVVSVCVSTKPVIYTGGNERILLNQRRLE